MSPAVYCVNSSPGPRYYIDSKITRHGKDGTPAYSMLGRMKYQSKLNEVIFFNFFQIRGYIGESCEALTFQLWKKNRLSEKTKQSLLPFNGDIMICLLFTLINKYLHLSNCDELVL